MTFPTHDFDDIDNMYPRTTIVFNGTEDTGGVIIDVFVDGDTIHIIVEPHVDNDNDTPIDINVKPHELEVTTIRVDNVIIHKC